MMDFRIKIKVIEKKVRYNPFVISFNKQLCNNLLHGFVYNISQIFLPWNFTKELQENDNGHFPINHFEIVPL